MRTLVFVHGRAQEHRDATALKGQWVDALGEGLKSEGLKLPIPETAIRFPYYGQTLFDTVSGLPADQVARVIVRGDGADQQEDLFLRQVLTEVIQKAPVTDEQIAAVGGEAVIERGPLNWKWIQAGLEAIDRYVPGASGASIALTTKDVYQYMKNPGIRDLIETGVRDALAPGEETVVVAHSLGTVVAYNLLHREAEAQGWRVPLLVTLGSPLGVTALRQWLAPIRYPGGVSEWFNAYDPDDIVALYPLDAEHFDVTPAIENWGGVDNGTSNQHGIGGYLSDSQVARRIHDALSGG